MRRLFGRNNPEVDPKTAYRMESISRGEAQRVLKAVTYSPATHLDEVGAYEAWAPYTSIFQRTAFEGPYGDIVATLARIESRVMFDD